MPWPGQSLYVTEEVTSTEQLQGVNFRAYNTATERLAQLMGAVPTTGLLQANVFILPARLAVDFAAFCASNPK